VYLVMSNPAAIPRFHVAELARLAFATLGVNSAGRRETLPAGLNG
jgi:hypothetical protein